MKAGGELFKRRGSGGGVSERVREWGDSCLVRYFDQVFKDFTSVQLQLLIKKVYQSGAKSYN